ncbi:MAG: hypothetical protein EXR99_08785 [Gemmataceae bacterium]|nr:hypothetical protein [Gemmataceae bacterium]
MSQIAEEVNLTRPPLGLPQGSVRALLTLLILGVVIHEMVIGREVDILWNETLLISLAHYFSRRRFINIPASEVPRLQKEGILPPETRPLYLPTGFIRALIILSFAALGVYLYREGRLFEAKVFPILGAVTAYVVGMFFGWVAKWFMKPGSKALLIRWQDFQASIVLIVLVITAALFFVYGSAGVPPWLRNAALFLTLYYFGAR